MNKSKRSDHSPSPTRRFVVQGMMAAGLLGLGVTGVVMSVPAEARWNTQGPDKAASAKQIQSGEQATAENTIDAALYSRVMRLRNEIALTNDDLAAMGLTQAQAEDVLTRLLDWVETNQPAMIQADNALRDARRAVVALQRRIQTGEADELEVQGFGDLYQVVADADAARKTLRHQAGAHAVAPAPENLRSQWAQAHANAHLPADLRHVPGLDEQRLRSLLGSAPETPGVSAASALGVGLTLSEQDELDSVRNRIHANRAGILAAEAEVLPLPAELLEDEGMFEVADGASER